MLPTPVAPGIRRLTTPLPYRPRSVHAYLVELGGGRTMLVDGGADTAEAWGALDAAVRAGAGEWASVALHVVTHMHVDHIGLAARVRTASGATLAMGRLDADRVVHAAERPEEEAAYRSRMLREAGASPELVAWAATAGARSPGLVCEHPVPEDGGRLPGVDGWHVVWTPGHTAGHISLFRESDGVLIAGDAVLPRITPTLGVNPQRDDPVGDYLDALDRLAGLGPARVLPGHGEPIEAPADRIAELRAETLAEADRVRSLLTREPRTVAEVVAARYPGRELPNPALMQAIRETRAHLDRLAAAGEARVERGPETVRFWQPVGATGGPGAASS